MKCSEEMKERIHQYLDHDIKQEDERILRTHLQSCADCSQHLHELEKSIALVQSTSHIEAPMDFTQAIMDRLPKEKKSAGMNRWLKGHPLLAAASLFVLLMTGSLFSSFTSDSDFSVSKQPNLVVENNTVTVPEGETIKGDVTVKGGTLNIEGKVEGDVTVINGEKYMASAGQVTGDSEEINEAFEWIWYQMKSLSKEVVDVFK
ncbi:MULTISPECIES: anti-sigma-W factor RsiW [Bacillaceae]|uniref:anti-sigma-W factor RsiW n=1 Tax=Bacillaceae TaxID=186817 RepID=UPI000C780EF3|nr:MULTISPECIES: anti-sigma-W factor RsiW [Bacillaceae]PLR65951.1 anti-sigma factor [Bacillus sp. UMB0893]